MGVSVEQFVENLTDSGLMSADEVAAFRRSLPDPAANGETLAKLLVRQKKLTKYQATAVYQGKIKHLMFGEYVVTDKIGAGGMGLVLKARHRRMDRDVAVKVLPAKMVQDKDAEARFYQEVKAAARLIHTNIVVAFEAGEHAGLHYLIMEYVEGRDLAAIVHEHGPLPVEDAVECVRQAAQGLQYAHDEGIVHRDIKPGNLLLDKKGTVKILDMGLARLNVGGVGEGEEKNPEQLTQSGQIMGTVDYMAPEQAEDTRKADHRADIYALGCTLFRLVTGNSLYDRDTIMQKLLAHREDEIPSMTDLRAEVPHRLNAVFQRMVAKNPDDRYQSMAEVIGALQLSLVPATQMARPAAPKKDSSTNQALTAFFDKIGDERVATKPRTAASPQETIDHKPSTEDTGDSIEEVEAIEEGVGYAPRTNSPIVTVKKEKVRGAYPTKIWIAAGGAMLAVVLLVVGTFAVFRPNDSTTLESAGDNENSRSVNPTGAPPPLAKAPFSEAKAKAKAHQEAWAKYLGVEVERDIELPGGEKLTMILIPPGEFLMGSTAEEQAKFLEEVKVANDAGAIDRIPSECPQHRVRITNPFYLGKYEVTQAQWQAVMGSNPSQFKDNPTHPVESVSWGDIHPFLAKLQEDRQAEHLLYTLPTEAQWEYACRAGTTMAFSFGDNEAYLQQFGWWAAISGGKTHPVGQLRTNDFGLYDLHGNVWEWCTDWYDVDYYAKTPADDPGGPSAGSSHVCRGGAWNDPATHCRSAYRNHSGSGFRIQYLGFRLAASIDVAAILAAKAKQSNAAPPLAKAPFGEQKAKDLQDAWAKYLGVEVERDIELPGGEKLTMVLIPPGEFLMGSTAEEQAKFLEEAMATNDTESASRISSEGPQHRVRITRPFYLGKYEVTQAQWQAVMGSNPSNNKDGPANPVEMVRWEDIPPFLVKLNQDALTMELKFALPTEAQWEYACRAGTTKSWYSGDSAEDLRQYGWLNSNSGRKTHPVGQLQSNGFGLYDLHGNVWEWCADWSAGDYYAKSPLDDPSGPSSGGYRAIRGGCFGQGARLCRAAYRFQRTPLSRTDDVGFRLAAAIEDTSAVNAEIDDPPQKPRG